MPCQTQSREELVKSVDDPDFGRLKLWRTITSAKGGWLSRPVEKVAYDWRGKVTLQREVAVDLAISNADEKLEPIGLAVRAAYRQLIGSEPQVRRLVSERVMDFASDWADSAGVPDLTVDLLSSWLRLASIWLLADADAPSFTFWYDEPVRDIFAGHIVHAEFDASGKLTRAVLAG